MNGTSNTKDTRLRLGLTRTLLKFCEDHRYPAGGLTEIRACLKALELGDVVRAMELYRKVPLGGRMGYFDDWIAPVVFSHETPEYVQVVFDSLVTQWRRLMDE